MKIYDYLKAETTDIIDYLNENKEVLQAYRDSNYDTLDDYLNDILFNEDAITGNGSGSYTFNNLTAAQNLIGNWNLLNEAAIALDVDKSSLIEKGPEYCDVLIRCFLLPQAIEKAIKRL